jgi:hypothetical protein
MVNDVLVVPDNDEIEQEPFRGDRLILKLIALIELIAAKMYSTSNRQY